jgi:hypothetical protein
MSSTSADGGRGSVVPALSRAEGWQLVSHPIILVGVAIALLGCAMFVRAVAAGSAISWEEDGWTAAVGVLLLAILTMVGTNLAALRDRRSHTAEQHASLPVRPPIRTSGLLAAALWPTCVAASLLAFVAALGATQDLAPNAVELIHLVTFVVTVPFLGATGIALATWVPTPFVAPVVAWFVLFVTPGEDSATWQVLIPWQTMSTTRLAVWHVVYLCGLTAIVSLIALAKTSRPRSIVAPTIVSAAVVLMSAAVLLNGACPAEGACRF